MSAGDVWLVDASIWIFRAWFALPDSLTDEDGEPAHAVQGWAGLLLGLLAEQRPTHLGVAFDESLGSGFRHRLWPDYKRDRALPDADLARQLQQCRRLTEALGIDCAASSDVEADDLIAGAAAAARSAGWRNRIVSRDKDLLGVLRDDDRWEDPSVPRSMTVADTEARFGVHPQHLADYQALVGDAIDGVPGLPGIGPGTARALLQRWTDLEGIYAAVEGGDVAASGLRGAAALQVRLATGRDDAFLFRRLTRLGDEAMPLWCPHLRGLPRPDAARARGALRAVGLDGRLRRRVDALDAPAASVGS